MDKYNIGCLLDIIYTKMYKTWDEHAIYSIGDIMVSMLLPQVW